ncbi:hypothetical protein GCM10010531_15180 [Blastococcus jejuensis]|uniref:Transposase n=1 Tax=Blastococcus jejuensis TaxID=351224 RepID=A0ABP6P0Y5_9ACTN
MLKARIRHALPVNELEVKHVPPRPKRTATPCRFMHIAERDPRSPGRGRVPDETGKEASLTSVSASLDDVGRNYVGDLAANPQPIVRTSRHSN